MPKSLLILLLLPLLCPADAANALPASFYGSTSHLASGHWVKIQTDTSGIFQVTPEQLAEWGFDKADAVRVYGTSAVDAAVNTFGTYPDDLIQLPSVRTADGRILFYAEGDVRGTVSSAESATFTRNYYDTTSAYFLGATGETLPLETVPYSDAKKDSDRHYCLRLTEREVQNPGHGGVIFHGRRLGAGENESFTFDLSGFCNNATGFFGYTGAVNCKRAIRFSSVLSSEAKQLRSYARQSTANTLETRLYTDLSGNASFTLREGAGQMTATVSVPASFDGDYAAVDKAYVIYPRYNSLEEAGALILNLPGILSESNFVLTGAEEAMAWDITDPLNIKSMELHRNDDGSFAGTPEGRNSRIVAFSPAVTHRSVHYAGTVANTNLHALATPEMVVVSTASLMESALEYAAVHSRLQGMDVAVVCQDDIFNEFSSGARTPAAVRRFLKMLADRTPGRLRYLTLYGVSTYDNRFVATEPADYLICYECEDPDLARDHSTNYVSDQYFGMLSDTYKTSDISACPMDISVGRIPASDSGLARKANEQSRRRLKQTPSAAAYLRALKFSDDGDYRLHFDHTEEAMKALLDNNDAITIARADNLLYPWKNGIAEEASRKLIRSLVRGQGFFHYAGHGTAHDVTAENLYTNQTVSSLSYDYAPLALFASCNIFPLDNEYGSMAENLIFSGGAVGVITSSRKVYIDPNRIISNAIAACYATARPGDSGADILRTARNSLIKTGMSSALGNNTLCYNYCGDPALPLDVPEYTIETVFPDMEVRDGAVELDPLRRIKIEGTVRTASGETATSFNGPVLIEVFDRPDSLATFSRNEDDGESVKVLCDDNLLAEYGAVASAGKFAAEIILPEPADCTGTKRIVVTAADALSRKCAASPLLRARISENCGTDGESETPQILAFEIDPEDHISPEAVGPDFTARAVISQPAAGIATGNSGIRRALTVTVDGRTMPDLRGTLQFGDDGNATLAIPLRNMSQGRHEIRLDVFSNTGAGASASLTPIVGTEGVGGRLEAIGADPARDEVEFILHSECDRGTLIITDHLGNTVYSCRDCAFPFTWNVCDSEDRPLPAGYYKAWVLLDNGLSLGSTQKIEIIVIR